MRRLARYRPSPAMAVALVALFVALSGTGYAAFKVPRNSVGPTQLKAAAVTPPKVAKKTIALFKGQRGLPGATGAQGPAGPAGPTGAQGPPGPSTGGAGGDLAGSYPNPTIASGAITTAKFAAGAQAPDSAKLGGVAASSYVALANAGMTNAVPLNAYAYFMNTSTTADYVFGQAKLHTVGVAGDFEVCGNAGGVGNLNYVAYVNGTRTAGAVTAQGCTAPFTIGATGDCTVTIRRALIFCSHSGDSTTNQNYDIYGFSQL